MAEKQSAFQLAMFLAVLGGIVVILWGVLRFTSLIERGNVPSLEFAATVAVYGALGVALGLISVAGSKFVKHLAWSMVLIVSWSLGLLSRCGISMVYGARTGCSIGSRGHRR